MYTSFHNHSYFSVLDGFASPKEYLDRAKELNLKGFQISEHGNEYSWVYFDELKKNYPDLKMLFGVELYECADMSIKDPNQRYYHLLATCINEQSRIAMNEIVTRSNLEGFYYKNRVDLNLLKPYGHLFVVSSACLASKLAREKDYQKCVDYVYEYKSIFPHFYLELMSHSHPDQIDYNQKLMRLSQDTHTDFIITCDSHAATEEDLYYQGRLVQVARDEETLSETYADCFLQSEEQIHVIMDGQIGKKNVDFALENTNKICDLVETVSMPFQSPKLPTYPLPEGISSNAVYLVRLTEDGWGKRKFDQLPEHEQQVRKERLEYELKIIHQLGFDGYFLVVWDFINWAKNNNVMVGPGRGSGGGSIVCYLLGISELDPIKYDLIFERFLNPERVSMADLDLDFSDRDKVVQYIINKYGETKVCQIINFNFITPVVAIKDTARILGMPYAVSESISKKFTYDTFQECLDNNQELLDQYAEYGELFKIGSKLSGRLRNVSIHAGGVGIVDTKISDYMAMKLGAKNERVIQVDKKKAEDIGIIKFDILGVSTLSVIQEIIWDAKIDPWEIDPNNDKFLHDEEMFKILRSANTNGVFQVESSGMKDLLIRLAPNSIKDISAVLALYRPDSMDFLEDYIHYKHNPESIQVWHNDMLPIVNDTYGCIVYQEQLMNIVRQFGGRTMGGADKFRKAIGKKDIDLVKKEAHKLYQEIVDNGYSNELALKISEYLSSKGGYMFNSSHAFLYAVLTLQTAYLKAHYPVYFFKALFNQNKNDYGSLNKYIIDSQHFNVETLPPSANNSDRNFTVYNGKILFGLEAIKGIGSKLVDEILWERSQNGKFNNFDDFLNRVKPSTSQVVALIKSGAIPCKNKKGYLLQYADQLVEKKSYTPVSSLPTTKILAEKWGVEFDKSLSREEKLERYNRLREKDYKQQQKEKYNRFIADFTDKYLQSEETWEFETLSIFLKENPFKDAYSIITPVEDVIEGGKCVVVGIISDVTKKTDRHGKQFAFLNIYSLSGLLDVTLWHTQYKEYQDMIKKGIQVSLLCKKTDDNRLIVEKMKTYQQWFNDIKSNKKNQFQN
jgi:DNA polymerase-3 subunit alpha